MSTKKKKPVMVTKKATRNSAPKHNNAAGPQAPSALTMTEIPTMVGGFTYGNAPAAVLPGNTPSSGNMNITQPVGSTIFQNPNDPNSDATDYQMPQGDPGFPVAEVAAPSVNTVANPIATVAPFDPWPIDKYLPWILIAIGLVIGYYIFKKGSIPKL